MSKYTTQLRWVIEQAEIDSNGAYEPGIYTEASYKKIGLSNYPILTKSIARNLTTKLLTISTFAKLVWKR